ncbi:M20/M25/M40 family metallo-hydrolase [Luteimonas arsenica]|uniref:M20/M25/M40 family metallo-hydrolase n=1 Tax=Luteimonas arsenica TaxID=1586242 RepID=UPI001056D0FC|nr:M20/M25/M40 family metallo-hydrolase [Luteimonas arsenica]
MNMRILAGPLAAACLLLASGAVSAHDHGAMAFDPMAPVYVVAERGTFQAALRDFSGQVSPRRDALGRQLVLAGMREHQLEDLSRHVHEVERRCGGYFAFATRAEAEAFVASDASLRGFRAALPAYAIEHQGMVNGWLPQVSEPAIRATIQHLSTAWPNRYYASSHGHAAPLWIRDQWLSLAAGRSDVSAELFTACNNCGGQPSVILTIQGTDLADEIVVLGGHLDSISNSGSGDHMNAPGADDDASGIATLTEVLRIAMVEGYRPRRTVMFMAYSAEEVGLRGSRAIAQRFAAEGRNVVGVLQMDMTNYRSPGSTSDIRVMTDNSNPQLVQFLKDLFDAYLAPLGYTRSDSSCGYACSDHASWTQAGFPAAMYDEGPFFPLLHTTNDTLDRLGGNAQHATIIARLGLAFMGELGREAKARLQPPPPITPPSGDSRLRRPTLPPRP